MSLIAVQARLHSRTELPRDDTVNVLHYITPVAASFGHYTGGVADAYVAHLDGRIGGVTGVTCTAYDLSNAKPRPPQNVEHRDFTITGAPMPREVALCLSFFADRNLKRHRGRIYVGPWLQSQGAERPSEDLRTRLIALAQAFSDVGTTGPIVHISGVDGWAVQSIADSALRIITDAWVDDEWDTQRRRGLKSTARSTVSGLG
jgi:hypothetical protein